MLDLHGRLILQVWWLTIKCILSMCARRSDNALDIDQYCTVSSAALCGISI